MAIYSDGFSIYSWNCIAELTGRKNFDVTGYLKFAQLTQFREIACRISFTDLQL
jgi:hypothetical protein